jgi:hypothetical protein
VVASGGPICNEATMAYMLLILEHEDRRRWPEAAAVQRHAEMMRFRDQLDARGVLQASNSLRPVGEGVRISLRGGRRAVVDGPFAEAKEIVGGFFLLDCATREDALAIAHECPATTWGTVEVREVGTSCLPDHLQGR